MAAQHEERPGPRVGPAIQYAAVGIVAGAVALSAAGDGGMFAGVSLLLCVTSLLIALFRSMIELGRHHAFQTWAALRALTDVPSW